MAKHEHVHNGGAPVTEAAPPAPPAPIAAPTKGGNQGTAMLKNGERRIDFIRRRWSELTVGKDLASNESIMGVRSQITKEINEQLPEGAKPVPYQIVFGATKGYVQAARQAKAAATATAPAPAGQTQAG